MGSTRCGSAARFCRVCRALTKCGSAKTSTMRRDPPSCTESAPDMTKECVVCCCRVEEPELADGRVCPRRVLSKLSGYVFLFMFYVVCVCVTVFRFVRLSRFRWLLPL